MKKIFSLLLAALMLVSAMPVAYAADVNYDQGTKVEYTAANAEAYSITVPAALAPGQGGTVTLQGTWPSNKTIFVTADETVTLKNSINAADTKTLAIDFDGGISASGNNETEQTIEKEISVAAMPEDAIFGTWSGTFYYNVESEMTVAMYSYNGVELPDINAVWTDKEAYPYAVIDGSTSNGENYYRLLVFDNPVVLATEGDTTPVVACVATTTTNGITWDLRDGEWTNKYQMQQKEAEGSYGTVGFAVWSNFDLLDYDDRTTVVIEASDPVLVSSTPTLVTSPYNGRCILCGGEDECVCDMETEPNLIYVVNAVSAIGVNSINVQTVRNFLTLHDEYFDSDDYAEMISFCQEIHDLYLADYAYTYFQKSTSGLTEAERAELWANILPDEAKAEIFSIRDELANDLGIIITEDVDAEGWPVYYYEMRS